MTRLGLLNFLVLQWFGVRLARTKIPGLLIAYARRDIRAGEYLTTSDVDRVTFAWRWTLLRWIWPLTGWWSPFRWIARRS